MRNQTLSAFYCHLTMITSLSPVKKYKPTRASLSFSDRSTYPGKTCEKPVWKFWARPTWWATCWVMNINQTGCLFDITANHNDKTDSDLRCGASDVPTHPKTKKVQIFCDIGLRNVALVINTCLSMSTLDLHLLNSPLAPRERLCMVLGIHFMHTLLPHIA